MFELNKDKVLVEVNSIIVGVTITLDAELFDEMETIEQMESVFKETCLVYFPSISGFRAKPSSSVLYNSEWVSRKQTSSVKIVDGLMGGGFSPIINQDGEVTFGVLLEFDGAIESICGTVESELCSFNENSFVKSITQYNTNQRVAILHCDIDGSSVTQQLLLMDDSVLLSDLEEMFKSGELELTLSTDIFAPTIYSQANGGAVAQVLKSKVSYDHAYEYSLVDSSLIKHGSLLRIIESKFSDFQLQYGSVGSLPKELGDMVFAECVKTLGKINEFAEQNAILSSIDAVALSEFQRTINAKMTIEQVSAQVRKILM